jgi:hypothetical protein
MHKPRDIVPQSGKTLLVGQDVFIHSGPVWHYAGKVVNVTPSGVEVQISAKTFQLFKLTTGAEVELPGKLVRFDTDGTCECGTRECGPWIIDDEMPFAERKAQIQQTSREGRAELHRVQFFGNSQERQEVHPAHEAARQRMRDFARSKQEK